MRSTDSLVEVWKDISEQFAFLDEHLVYVDAPLEGFVRALRSGALFAFRCTPIVPGAAWHWVLLPASSTDDTVDAVFAAARISAPAKWLSIIEDRRGNDPQLHASWISGETHSLPGSTFDQ
jgi:hypothetical protein